MMIFLMFTGASPGSCGGGIKTTTLALISAFTVSRIRGKSRVNMFRKSIPAEVVNRSISLILVSFGVIAVILFLVLAGNPASTPDISKSGETFLAYLFETVSAFGTVGLSMGITPDLNLWGKCMLTLMMIIGRVGVLTFSYIVVGTVISNGIEFSEERIMIG
jgi:trk system potassium uptake protein TrkH